MWHKLDHTCISRKLLLKIKNKNVSWKWICKDLNSRRGQVKSLRVKSSRKKIQFLGCEISYEYNRGRESKINKFGYIREVIKCNFKNKIRKDTRIKIYRTIAGPKFLYGSELWVLEIRQETQIQAMKMGFFRAVKECSNRDWIRKSVIR